MNPEHDIETQPDPAEDEWVESAEPITEAEMWSDYGWSLKQQ